MQWAYIFTAALLVNLKKIKMKKILMGFFMFYTHVLFAQKKCVSGDCINGFGKMTDIESKESYEGNWKNGMKEGQGTYTDYYSTYTGNWHEDIQQGLGEYKELQVHDGKIIVSRIYTGNFDHMDHRGQGKCIIYTDWGTKIMFVMEGNFERQQLSGKGSLIIPNEGTYYSDTFKDNFNFTSGYLIKNGTQGKLEGSLVQGTFKSEKTDNTSNNIKTLPPVSYKIYCFKTQCSSRGKSFYVISKITADISRHSFDEIKNEAIRMFGKNGWYANGAPEYLGIAEDVRINGTPGRDYVVSESTFYEFKKN